MRSVFTEPPPSFSQEEVYQILKKSYHVIGEITELYSDRDQNFIISTDSEKYILKIFNCAERESTLDLQLSAINYIVKNNPEVQVPKPIGEIVLAHKENNLFRICLFEYIRGSFLYEKKMGGDDYLKMGKFMGQFSKALSGFDHPGSQRIFEWDIQDYKLIYQRMKYIKSNQNQQTVHHFLNKFEDNVIPHLKNLRMSVIHNDGNDHNILVDEKGETTGIIDFGDMVFSYQALEPAVCLAYIALDKKNPLPLMSFFLRGYQSSFPLTNHELQCLIYMTCVRLCLTVSMAAWRKTIFPDNKYLTISEPSAWSLLKKLEGENLNKWTEKLIHSADS